MEQCSLATMETVGKRCCTTLTVPYCFDILDIDLWIGVDAVSMPYNLGKIHQVVHHSDGEKTLQLRTYIEKVKRYIAS